MKSFIVNMRQNLLFFVVLLAVTVSVLFRGIMYYNTNVKREVFMEAFTDEMPDVGFTLIDTSDGAERDYVKDWVAKDTDVAKTLYYDVENVVYKGEAQPVAVTKDYSELRSNKVYRGRNPLHANEVAIGWKAAEEAGKSIGDTIEYTYGAQKAEYLITGLTQSANYMGRNQRDDYRGVPAAER